MRKASRKKKIERKKAIKDTLGRTWGFDYGLSVRAVALGSFDFNQKLRDADVIAVAYGLDYSFELDCRVPAITIVGRNEEPLRRAYDEFVHWAEYSDADAVDVTLVFLKSGGYRLMISPEPKALIYRTLRYDVVVEPISFQVSWIKPIDTVSEPLRQLREHLQIGIRPYMLSAAIYSGLATPDMPPIPELLRTVRGIRQLLKFKIRFADEGGETENDFVKMVLLNTSAKSTKRNAENNPHLPPPESLLSTRMNRLRTIFPVTLWRANNNDAFRSICEALEQCGLRRWQVQQALCNAVVSREIAKGLPHFEGIKQKDWPNTLVAKLGQRYEIADGRIDLSNLVSSEELVRQAILDAGALLKGWGLKRPPDTVELIQKELIKRNLLD